MALSPPKLRRLQSENDENISSTVLKPEVWEIPVPVKTSLFWSIILSYLMSIENDSEIEGFLKKFQPGETKQRKKKKPTCNISCEVLKKCIRGYNPFKNRYVFFHNNNIISVMQAFKLLLNQYANTLLSETNEWNSELKLYAASKILNCKIEVYFPDDNLDGKIYFRNSENDNIKTIVLFQYKDKEYRGLTDKIDIFRFALNVNYAFPLQLSALMHIFQKAKFQPDVKQRVRHLMSVEGEGRSFLTVIFRNNLAKILQNLYQSPYIALKLSEAGFETNLAETDSTSPSSFIFALKEIDAKYARILYDYAANCRYRYDKTTRNADENVLCNLSILHELISKDITKLSLCKFDEITSERIFCKQKELLHFNKYQQEVSMKIKNLQSQLSSGNSEESVRKDIISSILDSYNDFFYHDTSNMHIHEIYTNYLNFTEFYENTDCFTGLLFFDNLHSLKQKFQAQKIFSDIESKFFHLILSNKIFPKFKHEIQCESDHDKTKCEEDKNTLQFIPLSYREALKSDITTFQGNLRKYSESEIPRNEIKENSCSALSNFPEIRDELLIFRLGYYLQAAMEIPPEEGKIKSFLAIERALQVLGESIKPQSTKDCVVSYLLNSQLPPNLKKDLITIRNKLSHYKDMSAQKLISTEKITKVFQNLQSDLERIENSFKIVAFTQDLRIESYLMNNPILLNKIEEGQLNKNIIDKLHSESELRINVKTNTGINYRQYFIECVNLTIHVLECLKELGNKTRPIKKRENKIYGMRNALEFMFKILTERLSIRDFCLSLEDLEECFKSSDTEKNIEQFSKNIEILYKKVLGIVENKLQIADISSTKLVCSAITVFSASLQPGGDNNDFSLQAIISEYRDQITEAVKKRCEEAENSKTELIKLAEQGSIKLSVKEENLIEKLMVSKADITKLRSYFKLADSKKALKKIQALPNQSDLLEKYEKNPSNENIKNLLLKITFQKKLKTKNYTSATLSKALCDKLENLFTTKLQFLLNRINNMKSILFDEDDEIKETWNWGRSTAIKHHMKYLMRQRFLREKPVRAALEMAFFDCLNILHKDDLQLKLVYEKLNNLFTGVNLRNALSHGNCVLETVGAILDKDDLPSEFINKILQLIEDSEAIEYMYELIPMSDTLEQENFKTWINMNQESDVSGKVKKILKCPRWSSYLFLLPLV